jgi:hypothetical protein
MSMQSKANGRALIGKSVLCLILVVAAGCSFAADATIESADSTVKSARPQTQLHAPFTQAKRHHNGTGLDDRVNTLTKALDLDATQQSGLRKVLESQREQVARVWNDESVPAAYRVVATQAISDKTADQIRALLNDEQKKKYNPPKPHNAAPGSTGPSVEDWMNKTKPK